MVDPQRKRVNGLMHTIKADNGTSREKILEPFILSLPSLIKERFEILNSHNSSQMHSGQVTLGKGECIGEHTTGGHEELIIILEGDGEIEAEGSGRNKITAGQVAYNPPFTKHNVFNTGTKVLRYIYVVAKV
jgi:quercetin dioxygenase-like cupin family protein